MTKTAFLAAMRAECIARYPWAADTAKLDRFMESVQFTIESKVWSWNHDGAACVAAWAAIGGKGKPTMKALRALAD